MIENIWYCIVVSACLLSLINWRAGVYLGIALDCLRDPVRKLSEDQSVLVTLTGAAVWVAVMFRVFQDPHSRSWWLFRQYPRLRTAVECVLLALIPSAVLSCVLYASGWKLAAVGLLTYLGPLAGLGIGYAFAQSEQQVYRLFAFYSVLNGLMLIGVPLEYLKFEVPGLGGMNAEWIRYRTGYTVDLMCGFYRSPDIMGLHAAHVIMFSGLLAVQGRTAGRFGWIGVLVCAGFCVLLSGRRKMIGIPLVFLVTYVGLSMMYRLRHYKRLLGVAVLGAAAAAVVFLTVWDQEESDDYTSYAVTIATEGLKRVNDQTVLSSIGTVQQVGILGAGLGTATQGRYYVDVKSDRKSRGWQEDGLSRLVLEFGVPGTIVLLLAVALVIQTLAAALRDVPPNCSVQMLQIGLVAVVVADGASYVISHQQFSGDPVNSLLVIILIGMVLACPRMLALARQAALARRPADHSPLPMNLAAKAAAMSTLSMSRRADAASSRN